MATAMSTWQFEDPGYDTSQGYVFANDGTGLFTQQPSGDFDGSHSGHACELLASDLDADGDSDLIVGYCLEVLLGGPTPCTLTMAWVGSPDCRRVTSTILSKRTRALSRSSMLMATATQTSPWETGFRAQRLVCE